MRGGWTVRYRGLESGGASAGPKDLLIEAIGTFLVALALFNVGSSSTTGALTVGGMLSFATWFQREGAFNPAVTCARLVRGHTSPVEASLFILAQTSGAVVALLFTTLLNGVSLSVSGSGSGGDGRAEAADAILTLVLLFTHSGYGSAGPSGPGAGGLDLGLCYFSGLAAFPSPFGGNPAAVAGVVLGNFALGGDLNLSRGTIITGCVPLATAMLFPFLSRALAKTPRASELVGTWFFVTMTYAIGGDRSIRATAAPFALGTTLHTILGFRFDDGGEARPTFNPAASLARSAHALMRRDMSSSVLCRALFDLIVDLTLQTMGATLAVVAATQLGLATTVPAAPTPSPLSFSLLASSPAILVELVFSFVVVMIYLSHTVSHTATTLTIGLTYFACAACFTSSTFNPAVPLGVHIAALCGIGDHAGLELELTSIVTPLVAALVAALVHGRTSTLQGEGLGTFLLVFTLGASGSGPLSALALGAMLTSLQTVFGGLFNPALTVAAGGISPGTLLAVLIQCVGATAAAILGGWADVASGATLSPGGMSDGGRSIVAEALLGLLLVRTHVTNAADAYSSAVYNGFALFALLTALGSTAGSISNPAAALGGWIASCLLGGGLEMDTNALVGLGAHILAPLAGCVLSLPLYVFIEESLPWDTLRLDGREVFGSFVVVLAATGVDGSDTASVAFAYGMILATVYRFYPSQSPRSDRVDLHPSISAMRAFGDRANVAGFVAKLGAQVLGAFLAALTIGWIFVADLEDVVTPGSETTTRIWRDGALSSFVFSVGFAYAGNEFNLGITYFVGSCVFGALTNPAATLGATLATLLSGGTVVLDAAFASALLAPLIGGILAGRLPPFVGR